MRRNHLTKHHPDREHDEWVVDALSDGRSLPRSGRKHLKDLDQELQRFMARVSALEDLTAYDREHEDPNLAVEAEEIYREALTLRVEIRECLATGQASQEGVVESIHDSWNQLRVSFDDLRSSVRKHRPGRTHSMTTVGAVDVDLDSEELDIDEFDDDLEVDLPSTGVEMRIHRPRGGPKR